MSFCNRTQRQFIVAHLALVVCAGPGGEDDEQFDTFLRDTTWKLPDVVWDWSASPPPPPPAKVGAYYDLVAADPEGMENLREKILEFWPSLTYVASQSYGSSVGRERSSDGLGFGPVYHVSRYSMSTAFLATEHFRDKDSLSARMVSFVTLVKTLCKISVLRVRVRSKRGSLGCSVIAPGGKSEAL